MTHPVEDLTAYVDGALPANDAERIAQHLAGCATCRAEHERLAGTTAVLRRLAAAPAVSPSFEQRFYARLAHEKVDRRGWLFGLRDRLGLSGRGAWRWLAPALAGAAAVAVVVVYTDGRRQRADETVLASHLDLFESYEAVANVDVLDRPEDVQMVAHLHELRDFRRTR